MLADSGLALSQDYALLQKRSPNFSGVVGRDGALSEHKTANEARKPVNKSKNRYIDIIPCKYYESNKIIFNTTHFKKFNCSESVLSFLHLT